MPAQTSSFFQNDLNAMTFLSGSQSSQAISLVNHVFNPQHGKRIAVILNDFGEEIRVEREMINERERDALVEEWVELANGCVCCTVKHSLVQALEQLVQMKGRRDHMLLETTGLANPAPLASVLWLDDLLESAVKLDSIITVSFVFDRSIIAITCPCDLEWRLLIFRFLLFQVFKLSQSLSLINRLVELCQYSAAKKTNLEIDGKQ
ncbi:hypothetical protein NC651_024934 [Populus alba x Populus x berolinensis]|nr:hypothetical protein NC651_024934 [Populus alba x Populus x berolinensis]